MKLSGAGPGKRALATEYMALKIARHLGLRVPDAQVLDLPRDFPWQAGTDEFYEAVQRSAGANLGVAFIADAHDLKARDLAGLPEPFVDRLAAIDALLQNVDRTAANPNIMRDAAGVHWAIDFGACLLFDRLARGANAPGLNSAQSFSRRGDRAFVLGSRGRRVHRRTVSRNDHPSPPGSVARGSGACARSQRCDSSDLAAYLERASCSLSS